MDPYDEERLRNEVIYLHGLWHQGPPIPPNPNPIPSPNIVSTYIPQPRPFFHSSLWHHQYSVNPRLAYPFVPTYPRAPRPIDSGTSKKRKGARNRRDRKKRSQSDASLSPGSEWPCPMPAEESAPLGSEWPKFEPRSTPATRPVSAQERARLEALQVQYKARQACRDFLLDFDDDDDDDEDDDVEDDEDDDGSEEFGDFILKIFAEDSELRDYYEKNCEGGEFCCLVCGVIGNKNAGKKFRDCVGLVQHSMTISNTMKKRAHRAFGNAVCKVLGWDVNRLPTIVINNEPLGCSLQEKPAESEGDPKENAGDGNDGSESSDNSNGKVSLEPLGEPVEQEALGARETINQVSQGFSKEDNLDEIAENIVEKISDARSDKGGGLDEVSHESKASSVEWVCKSSNYLVSSTAWGWPPFNTRSPSSTISLSAEEQANLAVLQLQHKALEACQEFLVGNVGSDCDEDESDDNNEDELMYEYDSEECEEFKFFLRVFTEDSDLRRYYENHFREGDFYCLVCGGIGKKVWKRFKDCFGLLQHSTAILRTKRKGAHRAYAQVICKVLGWDIDRLPTIVSKGEALGSSLAMTGNLSGEPEKSADDHIDDSIVLQESIGKVSSSCDINSREDHVHHKNTDM